MLGGSEAALTGMQAAGRMLGASAHNIANAHTNGFKRLKAIPDESTAGGVRVTLKQDRTAGPTFLVQAEGRVILEEGSNVDLQEELITSLQAAQLFQSTVSSLKAQDKVLGTLLDIAE